MRGEGRHDGVFALWYGKGPGVDRSGDALRHANLAGTSRHGGVLALMGDDHTAKSSTTAHQSEFHFVDVMIPILNPAGVQEILDYGLYGYAMSRFCGSWVGLKLVKDNIESTASADGSLERVKIITPADFAMPPGGLNIRPNDAILGQEERLQEHKRDAMLAFIEANKLNRVITSGGPNAKIGIITTGKSYLDVRQAFDDLGIDEVRANDLGIRLFKVGCPWPLGKAELVQFAAGLDMIIVVEEKRSLIEVQVREELYGTANQPLCVGKKDERGEWLFPAKGALDPNDIAIAIGERLLRYRRSEEVEAKVARLKQAQAMLAQAQDVAVRTPYFCSGCPHNTSTKLPEGSRAYAGIGCHYMAVWMDRGTETSTQMGGEGANWVGEAPFSKPRHVFQNLGDGTYNHSGVLALRWAVDTKTNITYKILFNDAVAMTGGQQHEGGLKVEQIAQQVRAEGRRAHRRRLGRARQIRRRHALAASRHLPSPRRARRRAAGASHGPRRHRAHLRSDLRGREATPPQARRISRSRISASSSTSSSARAAGIAASPRTASACSRSRPSSAASGRSINRTATRIFPASTASAPPSSPSRAQSRGRQSRRSPWTATPTPRACPIPSCRRSRSRPSRSSSPASAARASSPSARSSAWRPISSRRAAA